MFTRTLRFLSFAVLLLLLPRCEKSDLSDPSKPGSGAETTGLISSCGDPLNGNTILELVADANDPVNHRMNQIMYHYGRATRSVLQNPVYLCYVEEQLMADAPGVGISFLTLAATSTSFGQALNTALRQSILENNIYPRGVEPNIETLAATPTWDANAFLKSKMLYAPYDYDPVAYYVHPIQQCNPSLMPIILLAQEVDECEDVPGWNGATEILMSEAQVQASTRPVIFIGPGRTAYSAGTGTIAVGPPPSGPQPVAAEDRSSCHVDVDVHQIKNGYRYDSNNKSEICGGLIYYSATNMTSSGIFGQFWEDFNKGDRQIHKNDINASTIFNNDMDAFTIPANIFEPGVSVLHFIAYEHDWYASRKYDALSPSCVGPSGQSFVGRRKYQHEVYFKTCGYGSSIFLQPGSTFNFENEKCRFQFKRL